MLRPLPLTSENDLEILRRSQILYYAALLVPALAYLLVRRTEAQFPVTVSQAMK